MHLNESVASLLSHLTPVFCRTYKKLILVCDMDETLLTEVQDSERIVIRPKVGYMLKNLRLYYELCLVTYSTRDRTTMILEKFLDPDSKIFCNRVLCREDILPYYRNKMDAFCAHLPKSFGKIKRANREVIGNVYSRRPLIGQGNPRSRRPPVWIYMVALDDFPLAWSNISTCIPIRPFLVSNMQKNRSSRGEGNYVMSLYKFLLKLHHAVFKETRNLLTNIAEAHKQTPDILNVSCLSAYSVLTRIRRRPSQSHCFQKLCHSDPGHLINFEAHDNLNQRSFSRRSSISPQYSTNDLSSIGYMNCANDYNADSNLNKFKIYRLMDHSSIVDVSNPNCPYQKNHDHGVVRPEMVSTRRHYSKRPQTMRSICLEIDHESTANVKSQTCSTSTNR